MNTRPANSAGTSATTASFDNAPSWRRRRATATSTSGVASATACTSTFTRPIQYRRRVPGGSTSSSLPFFSTRPTSSTPMSARTKVSPRRSPRRAISASTSWPAYSGAAMLNVRTSIRPSGSNQRYTPGASSCSNRRLRYTRPRSPSPITTLLVQNMALFSLLALVVRSGFNGSPRWIESRDEGCPSRFAIGRRKWKRPWTEAVWATGAVGGGIAARARSVDRIERCALPRRGRGAGTVPAALRRRPAFHRGKTTRRTGRFLGGTCVPVS